MHGKYLRHHEHLRGLVYDLERVPSIAACLDACFDCSVLWDTVCTYARQNDMRPDGIVRDIIENHIYSPLQDTIWASYGKNARRELSLTKRWEDVEWALCRGRLTEAITALEADGETDKSGTDWVDLVWNLEAHQPELAENLQHSLHRPASRTQLIRFIGSLSTSGTLVRTEQNGLLDSRLRQ